MGENSNIEWCDHTFNPWTGCTKIAPGCANCYAETQRARYGFDEWGPGKPRKRTSATYWKQPLKWNREAEKAGKRAKVFCASFADVFDDEVPNEWRDDLFRLILSTPWLDWLLLTKRPEHAQACMENLEQNRIETTLLGFRLRFSANNIVPCPQWPIPNVWLGVSIANQADADKNIPILLKVPSAIRFISAEPLIGGVSLHPFTHTADEIESVRLGAEYDPAECDCCGGDGYVSYIEHPETWGEDCPGEVDHEVVCPDCGGDGQSWWGRRTTLVQPNKLDWVIVGGESDRGARPFDLYWARSIIRDCKAAGVPVFFKQAGSSAFTTEHEDFPVASKFPGANAHIFAGGVLKPCTGGESAFTGEAAYRWPTKDRKGGDPSEWPQDLRVREFPEVK